MKRIGLYLILALSLVNSVYADGTKLASGNKAYGFCIKDGDWSASEQGLYSFNLESPETTTKIWSLDKNVEAGAYYDGYYYVQTAVKDGTKYIAMEFGKIEATTGAYTWIADWTAAMPKFPDMTIDYTTNPPSLLALKPGGTTSRLMKIDMTTGVISELASGATKDVCRTLACKYDGTLYAVTSTRRLITINKSTGFYTEVSTSTVGLSGPYPEGVQSMEFDHTDGTLYWSVYTRNSEGGLGTIDLKTGLFTPTGTLGNDAQFVGLYIPFNISGADSPAMISDMSVTPGNEGAKNVSLTWTNPSKNKDGNALASLTSVRLYRNNKVIRTFDSPIIGSMGNYTDNITGNSGIYTYKLVAENAAGTCEASTAQVFVGEDVPKAPTNLVLTASGADAVLSWEAPVVGVNNGWINSSTLKYEITRNPGAVVVTTDATGTKFTDSSIDDFGVYKYSIKAKNSTGTSGTISSNSLAVGRPFTVPYRCDFGSQSIFSLWTVIDANADKKTWTLPGDYNAQYLYNTKNGADDWIISPPIMLEAGKYNLSFDYKVKSKTNIERLKVFYGVGATIVGQEHELKDYPALDNVAYIRDNIMVEIATAGAYNFSFYVYSELNKMGVNIDNVAIDAIIENDLEVVAFSGSESPIANLEYPYTVSIKNNGSLPQSSYSLQLIDENDNVLVTKSITEEIAFNEAKAIILNWRPTAVGVTQVRARVTLTRDQVVDNNISKGIEVNVQSDGSNQIITIGDGTEEHNSMPINFYYKSAVSQIIYLNSEIGLYGGRIEKIIYPYNNINATGLTKPIKIYLANTYLSTTTAGWIPQDQFTLVYEGNVTVEPGVGQIEITLPTPFIYSGNNLCVMNVRPMDTEYVNGIKYYLTTTTEDRARTYADENKEFDFTQAGNIIQKFPKTILKIDASGAGKIEGTVKCDNVAASGVKMTLAPLGMVATSDADGSYLFGYVPEGTYTLTSQKHGYENINESITVTAYQTQRIDADFVPLSKHMISGMVKNIDGNNVSGATVKVSGYDVYSAVTDENGAFIIENVYKAVDYSIRVTKLGLAPYADSFDIVDGNINLTITLNDVPKPPTEIVATDNDSNVTLVWNEPEITTTFRYDDGTIVNGTGFGEGTENGLFGSVHRVPAILNSMSWFTLGAITQGGPHQSVNIYVLDLNAAGNPTPNVLFKQMNVANVDDQWTTFEFQSPVECPNGFMIAISYTGYVGIGRDAGTSVDWPYVANGSYYSVDYTKGVFSTLSGDIASNFAIRAKGFEVSKSDSKYENIANEKTFESINPSQTEELISVPCDPITTVDEAPTKSEAKSVKGYRVWRLLESDKEDSTKWESLTESSITTPTYQDDSWATAPQGVYKYAVKTIYTEEKTSIPAFSNMVAKKMTTTATINVTTNTTPEESVAGAIVTLTNNDGIAAHIYTETVVDGKVLINNVWKGIYRVNISFDKFAPFEANDVDMTNDNPTHTYTLNEIKVKPFNLEIVKTDKESERIFNWNISYTIEEDFEDHDDFAINSQGLIGWSYIDGDGQNIQKINGVSFPNQTDPAAYLIFNPSQTTPSLVNNEGLKPHSGTKFLAAFPVKVPTNRDFFISPELTFGADFTFSFWAKSFTAQFGLERIKVGYSTTGKEEADFTNWLTSGEYVEVSADLWTKFTYTVPANAKYVTILCVSSDASILMVDDIFIGKKASKAFSKYTVYLDGEEVGITTSPTYTFSNLTAGEHTAGVKTVYTSGATEMSIKKFSVKDMTKKYAVNYNTPENGTLTVKNGETDILAGTMVNEGTVLTVTAIANAGYEIETFKANDIAIVNNSVAVTQTISIVATFRKLDAVTSPDTVKNHRIYPNPLKDVLKIEGECDLIEIYDAMGKLIMTANGENHSVEVTPRTTEIDVSSLSNGIYIIKVHCGETTASYKVLK